jgi:hypothetical protein
MNSMTPGYWQDRYPLSHIVVSDVFPQLFYRRHGVLNPICAYVIVAQENPNRMLSRPRTDSINDLEEIAQRRKAGTQGDDTLPGARKDSIE